MNKGDLQKLTGLSSSTIAKLSKNEVVKLDVVDRICETLKVSIYDVVRKYSGISIFQLDLMDGWRIEDRRGHSKNSPLSEGRGLRHR